MSGDKAASVDVFRAFMDPLVRALERNPGCNHDDANDSALDALYSYFQKPQKYDPRKSSLITYLGQIARRRAQDRYRAASSRTLRDQDFGSLVELWSVPPNKAMETRVEVHLILEKIDQAGHSEKDKACLRLMFAGERSTDRLAEVLELMHLPQLERRREVKRNQDRLMKALKRLFEEGHDDES
ncbi:sigma-70 family RNA polymerase sigma factor [Corallococcus exercitus]|uniref:Sigma-70 family RNA polymerase sigma factor n=2 Tax=Corallococcus exercitus TaxID=2316736 RepID=A0A7Y4KTX7_9BACT|nr:sigma factor [Corallococcus exercitus]NOK39089.1 sigma-70 family RNA polymerase sigma factor [Corallococcus exercitus]